MFMINNNVAFKAMDGIWLRGCLYILSFIYGLLCLIMEGIGSDELQNGDYFFFYFYNIFVYLLFKLQNKFLIGVS